MAASSEGWVESRFICGLLRQGGGTVEEKGWFWSCSLEGTCTVPWMVLQAACNCDGVLPGKEKLLNEALVVLCWQEFGDNLIVLRLLVSIGGRYTIIANLGSCN